MMCGDLNSLATQNKTMSLTLKINWQYGAFPEEGKWVHKSNNVGTYETLPQLCSLLRQQLGLPAPRGVPLTTHNKTEGAELP